MEERGGEPGKEGKEEEETVATVNRRGRKSHFPELWTAKVAYKVKIN
jgi:ribosomal protein L20